MPLFGEAAMTSSSTRSPTSDGASLVSHRRSARRVVYAALATTAAYYVGAKIGFALKAPPEPIARLWPPNAILLGILLLTRVRIWPVILLAALPAHLAVELGSGVPLPMVLSWYISNCTEALIGGAAIRWMIPRPVRFDTFRRVGIFVVLGAGVAPLLSSFLDAGFVHWQAFGADPEFWSVWRARLFSNVLSNLTIVPAIVHLRSVRLSMLEAVNRRRPTSKQAAAP
jgi:integral membrane sensor domain MASE1